MGGGWTLSTEGGGIKIIESIDGWSISHFLACSAFGP